MFILAYKLDEKVLKKILDYVDFGKGPNYDFDAGENAPGFIIKDARGYIFVKG
tara:strand:- start:4723 stop:4881 length:159 start_codon:yes stop_codon:yes gene_type:complete